MCSTTSGSSPRSSTLGSARRQVAEHIRGEVPGGERGVVERARAHGGGRCAVHAPSSGLKLPTVCCEKQGISRAGGPASKTYRQRELDQALPKIQEALLAGRDVIFHCNQSFHRAPVIAAAAYRRMTGGSAAVQTCCMTAVVAATSQIKYFLVWFYYVLFTVNLMCGIRIRCLCFFLKLFIRCYSVHASMSQLM